VQRIVRLGGAVDDDMANLLVAQLLYLDSADNKKDITMYVNSPGGSVTAGMAVFDTMRHIRYATYSQGRPLKRIVTHGPDP
jgi:ATP-dependent Clp protease protease subunit